MLLMQTVWIVDHHPYEHQYLNSIATPYRAQFCRDATRTSYYDAVKYLLNHAEEDEIVLNSDCVNLPLLKYQINLLTPQEQARFRYEPGGMYEISDYQYVNQNYVDDEGYDPWYTFYVDDCPILSILRNATRTAD